MNILAVDTTSDNMVIAISKNDEIFSRIGKAESKRHNSQILPFIDEALEEAKITLSEIDYLACVVGPGSFTGIRIGVSSVNALAFALSKKCVSVTALEELAFGIKEKDFYCAIDCRHDNFYYARFESDYTNMTEIGEMTLQELKKKDKVIFKDKPCDPLALIEIAKYKINAGKFDTLAPLYLKKSQAEREYDNKNMDKMG